MPEARTETKRTEPLRLARTESMLEARPKPEMPSAEEMFLSPRVLDAGAFARYAEMLKSMIAEARQGARDLQDFSSDADQMKATCEKTGEQIRTRIEAGARVIKLIDERSDRAEKLIDTVRRELPDQDRVRAMIEPAVKAALDAAQQRATEITLDAERRARATATEIEQKIAAMGARATEQATRLERVGDAIEQRLAGLEERLNTLVEHATLSADSFESRTRAATASANEELEPTLLRAAEVTTSLDDTVARAWTHADQQAGLIAERLIPLQQACDAVLDRLGLHPDDTDPSGSVLHKLEDLVQRSEAAMGGADRVLGQIEHLRGQAEGVKSDFGRWLLETAERVDLLEERRDRLTGPLADAAEKVARVSPTLADDIEIASTHLDQLATEQAILREAVQASAMLARKSSGDLNNQSAQLKALIDGSVHTLTKRVEEAGMWLGELIMRAENAARTIDPRAVAPTPAAAPAPASAPATPAPIPVIEPVDLDWTNGHTEAVIHTSTQAREPDPAPTPTKAPARRPVEPPANSYGLPLPPSLPIDALSFDGADVVFGRGRDQDSD